MFGRQKHVGGQGRKEAAVKQRVRVARTKLDPTPLTFYESVLVSSRYYKLKAACLNYFCMLSSAF
jgi:hypothetical protein